MTSSPILIYTQKVNRYSSSVRRRRKKYRLVVEVESLASSSIKNMTRRREDGVIVKKIFLKIYEHLIKILAIYLQQ